MVDHYTSVLAPFCALLLVLNFANGQQTGSANVSVPNTTESPLPGDYPGTDGGMANLDQGLIDMIINRLLGRQPTRASITSVKYGYTGEDDPVLDLSLNISGLEGRENLEPLSLIENSYIQDPSGDRCSVEFGRLQEQADETEGWITTGINCEFDEMNGLEEGEYELKLEEPSGKVHTAEFDIPKFRQVRFPVIEKEIIYDGQGPFTENHRYRIQIVTEHRDGVSRFEPEATRAVIEGPGIGTENYTDLAPVNWQENQGFGIDEYHPGESRNSTLEFVIPVKNYSTGEYSVKIKSNETGRTYGSFSFSLTREKPELELGNPKVNFREEVTREPIMPMEFSMDSLGIKIDNRNELGGSITGFKYRTESMNQFESWTTKGKRSGLDSLPLGTRKFPSGEERITLPFGQSDLRWLNNNGTVDTDGTIIMVIETATGSRFNITGELSAPSYQCGTQLVPKYFGCRLREDAELENIDITRLRDRK